MAKNKREEVGIEKLTPESQIVPIGGKQIRVPGNVSEAEFMVKVNAAHVMHIYREALERFHIDEVKFSPKELKDLIEAGKSVAEQMGNAFAKADVTSSVHRLQPAEAQKTTDVDFSSLSKLPEVTINQDANIPLQPTA